MKLNLNDLSLFSNRKLTENWESVITYYEMIASLRELGVDKILINGTIKSTSIAEIPLVSLHSRGSTQLSFDREFLLRSLFLNYHEFVTIQRKEQFFFQGKQSLSLVDAFLQSRPVVSFTLDGHFSEGVIQGQFKRAANEKETKKASVKNIYKKDSENLSMLPDFRQVSQMRAEENPLWNQELIKVFLNSIGHKNHKPSEQFTSVEQKNAYLEKNGRVIVELCGWLWDPGLSRKNSSGKTKRIVFYSAKFKKDNVYLCIDLENPDFRFELCDKRGNHLGEYCWDGTKTSPPQKNHSIEV